MKNILITGATGFIGKNLKKELLKNDNYKIIEFNRDDSVEYLESIINEIDFIFHLAGEVRPNASDKKFILSHIDLTNSLVEIIENNKLKIPILYTSSKHAANPKNIYGQTKLDTEKILIEYSKKNFVSIYLYRLTHIFGEGCKPNYNSVISTWIYNSINNLDINIYDRDIKMQYLYVQDVVKNFIEKINENNPEQFYYEIEEVYNTTLGEVVDFIEEFNINIKDENYSIDKKNMFKNKLFNVYKYYEEALI